MPKLLMHTACLYSWFSPYTTNLGQRINAILDAGCDGVEISNGFSIFDWKPEPAFAAKLRQATVTVHAELGEHFQNARLKDLEHYLLRLPFPIANVTVHPDELLPGELERLNDFALPVCLENMDASRSRWKYAQEIEPYLRGQVALTYDTAHAEENELAPNDFADLPIREVHLSFPDPDGHYSGSPIRHALTLYRPDRFPQVPSCNYISLEGVCGSNYLLSQEISFVRQRLGLTLPVASPG